MLTMCLDSDFMPKLSLMGCCCSSMSQKVAPKMYFDNS